MRDFRGRTRSEMNAPRLVTLYSKPGCHLCEELRALLDDLQPIYDLTVEEIDILRDKALYTRYRYDIPVVLFNGTEIARGRVDPARLAQSFCL